MRGSSWITWVHPMGSQFSLYEGDRKMWSWKQEVVRWFGKVTNPANINIIICNMAKILTSLDHCEDKVKKKILNLVYLPFEMLCKFFILYFISFIIFILDPVFHQSVGKRKKSFKYVFFMYYNYLAIWGVNRATVIYVFSGVHSGHGQHYRKELDQVRNSLYPKWIPIHS